MNKQSSKPLFIEENSNNYVLKTVINEWESNIIILH